MPGAACSWDGQSLTLQSGEQSPSDARGDALPLASQPHGREMKVSARA